MYTDGNFKVVIDFMKHSPFLTELIIDEVQQSQPTTFKAMQQSVEQSLHLPHLHKLVLIRSPSIIFSFLLALAPDVSELQNVKINTWFSPDRPLECMVSLNIFDMVMICRRQVSASALPPATLVCTPHLEGLLRIDIRIEPGLTPRLDLHTHHCDQEVVLYQQYGLNIDTIRVDRLELDHLGAEELNSLTLWVEQIDGLRAACTDLKQFT
jgi:hypothetical protein